MIVKKFYAGTTREALRQVRDVLGADALILSNRQVGGGIEIMAVAETDVASLTATPAAAAPPPATQRQPATLKTEALVQMYQKPQAAATPQPVVTPQPAQPAEAASEASSSDATTQSIVNEIKTLRSMLEGQLAGFAWGDLQRREPAKVEVMRTMLAIGFSPLLARQLLDKMPANLDHGKGLRWVKAALVHNLRVVTAGDDIIERGGVYALVGPTGSGKTTTVAKLAARCTLKHGPGKLALLTTDSYRIGAHEQLRIYGKILNVPVYSVKDEADLQLTLADLQQKHLVLIDTVGMSQRDRRLAEQAALLCGKGKDVRRLLLLNATSQGNTLDDVVRAYQGAGMDGCILTKVDEAMSIGSVLDVMIRHKLLLHYVTNGQRVPEDIHLANALYLIDRAFKSLDDGAPFTPQENEYPLVMAASAGNAGNDDASYAPVFGGQGAGAYSG